MKKKYLTFEVLCLFCGIIDSSYAQLSFTSGVDPAAGPNGNYAAIEYYNFSNAGGTGEFATGTGNNFNNTDYVTWLPRTYVFTFTYDQTGNFCETDLMTAGEGIGSTIAIPAQPANELQIIDSNTGIDDLILTLTSINSTANGTINFAPGTTWTSAKGANLQAYLDSPTLFNSGFTLNGTITLDAPGNGTDYGNNFGSEIEINLANVPEPSTWALMAGGAGLMGLLQMRRKA